MTFEEINLYLDSLLSLFPDSEKARLELVELNDDEMSLVDFLREVVVIHDLDDGAIYSMKVWLGLSYKDLATIFGSEEKTIAQVIRNVRTTGLEPHRSDSGASAGGLSCFMVDQLLSSYIDVEISEASVLKAIQEHLDHCELCQQRCEALRSRDSQKLKERKHVKAYQVEEWKALEGLMRERRNFDRAQALGITIGVLVMVGFISWFIISKPNQILNVYEMTSK